MKPTCPKCNGALCYAPADVLGPDRITCKTCGWYTERRNDVEIKPISLEVKQMKNPVRGTCPLCKRNDVLLTSKHGECHRCYKRTAKGQDPNDTSRPMPAAPVRDANKTPISVQVEPLRSMPIDEEKKAFIKKPVKTVKPEPLPALSGNGCSIDVVQILDDAWLSVRAEWVQELNEAKPMVRLARASSMVSIVASLGS